MANYVSTAALNIAANAVTVADITVRLHTGAPGNSGTGNRIGAITAVVPAAGWSAAAAGVSEASAAIAFGVLSASAAITVTAYSLYLGDGTFLGWADLASDVAVAANEAFVLDAGTVQFTFTRKA